MMKAFPNPHLMGIEYCGMDLRDYFAAKWMQGHVANSSSPDMTMMEAASTAYLMADAMMEARK